MSCRWPLSRLCRDVEERVVMDGGVTRDLAHRQTGARIARERRFTLECRSFAHVVLLTDRITEAAEHGNSAALSLALRGLPEGRDCWVRSDLSVFATRWLHLWATRARIRCDKSVRPN